MLDERQCSKHEVQETLGLSRKRATECLAFRRIVWLEENKTVVLVWDRVAIGMRFTLRVAGWLIAYLGSFHPVLRSPKLCSTKQKMRAGIPDAVIVATNNWLHCTVSSLWSDVRQKWPLRMWFLFHDDNWKCGVTTIDTGGTFWIGFGACSELQPQLYNVINV